MALKQAHEGYQYQDLLATYFILKEVIDGKDSEIKIDEKSVANDKFDDLSISNHQGIFRKQIKYSNSTTNHTLGKQDISSQSYDLAIDVLFDSWTQLKSSNLKEIRLCLSWNEPTDELLGLLHALDSSQSSFNSRCTKLYKINSDLIWPEKSDPIDNWKRFKKQSGKIERNEFIKFCDQFVIEVNVPKFSLDVHHPGDLEEIVFDQLEYLGIGEFPNNNLNSPDILLNLLHRVARVRAKGGKILTCQILNELGIKTDFGAIEQTFPVDQEKNIINEESLTEFLDEIIRLKKVLLTAPPGAGKSWFITNLQQIAKKHDINVIKHYCYTDLQDSLQKDRITTSTFYGNLISELINEFPQLKEKKRQRFSSTLSELNLLLENVPRNTILIIDGLDHINRIYKSFGQSLSLAEIDIIEKLEFMRLGDKVSCLISSQPMQELESVTDFSRVSLPEWSIENVTALFEKFRLVDAQVENERKLSELLFEKSQGNLLYLTYLIKEVKKIANVEALEIEKLPPYSNNLTEYYEYLLIKIKESEDVPRILSGCSFRLQKEELKEITSLGDVVDKQLEAISPILKSNFSQGGYVIYHESFRRFIIERLQKKKLDVHKLIFNPIIEWLGQKDFFCFPKSFNFYFPLLFENDGFEKIASFIDSEFLVKCLSNGQSHEVIKKNHEYMLKTAIHLKSFPSLITLHELSRTLDSTSYDFYEEYEYFIDALGFLCGFDRVSQSLIFEGKTTVSNELGLQTCYLLSKQGLMPPWEMYSDPFGKGKKIELQDFDAYLRYNIDLKNQETIINCGNWIVNNEKFEYGYIFREEVKASIELLESEDIQKIVENIETLLNTPTQNDIITCATVLLTKDYLGDSGVEPMRNLILLIRQAIRNNEMAIAEQVENMFNGNFWFHNWVLYCIRLEKLSYSSEVTEQQLKDCFYLLTRNTEPFKGHPRACDLYSLNKIIHLSLEKGLSLAKTENDWKMIINALNFVSEKTSTYLQGSQGGPLTTDKLFRLLSKNCPKQYLIHVIDSLTNTLAGVERNHFHTSIGQYYLILSKLNSINGDKTTATNQFIKGINFLLGYTMRKDVTIEELIEPIVSLYQLFPEEIFKDFLKVKDMVDSVVQHTDGKETKHFPVIWFSELLKISTSKAILFLHHYLPQVSYNWKLEEDLKNLLIHLNGSYSVEEFLLARTFPTQDDHEFILYRLKLFEKIPETLYDLARVEIQHIYELVANNKDKTIYSDEVFELLDEIFQSLGINNVPPLGRPKPKLKERYPNEKNIIQSFQKTFTFRVALDEMSEAEVTEYVQKNGIKYQEKLSFYYYYAEKKTLTEQLKSQIKSIASKRQYYEDNIDPFSDNLFEKGNDLYIYYWVSKYTNDTSGWFESFVNTEAFEKAYSCNPTLSLELLFESLYDTLKGLSYHRKIPSNLINALVKCGADKTVIHEMWTNLKTVISSRLPHTEEESWEETFANELDLTEQELLQTLIISRFQNGSIERYHRTISSIHYLLEDYGESMTKLLTWFFKNSSHFISTTYFTLLQLLWESRNGLLINNPTLKKEIIKDHPERHFGIDFLRTILYPELRLSSIVLPSNRSFIPVEDHELFLNINFKYGVLERMGLDLKPVHSQYLQVLNENYQNDADFFHSKPYSITVPNIYPTEYLQKNLNESLYNEIQDFPIPNKEIFDVLKLELGFLVSINKSYIVRPNILKPSAKILQPSDNSIQIESDWVRISFLEFERTKDIFSENRKSFRCMGAVHFSSKPEFPFFNYQIHPRYAYNDFGEFEIDDKIATLMIQKPESLEEYAFLWLNPRIIEELEILLPFEFERLEGRNEMDEVVLKYEHWKSDFLTSNGTSYGSLGDEYAQIEGCHLMLRTDYFDKLCNLFSNSPIYTEIVV